MIKLVLLAILAFGAYCAIATLFPSSGLPAFHAWGHAVPWIAIGVGGIGYIGYKSLK